MAIYKVTLYYSSEYQSPYIYSGGYPYTYTGYSGHMTPLGYWTTPSLSQLFMPSSGATPAYIQQTLLLGLDNATLNSGLSHLFSQSCKPCLSKLSTVHHTLEILQEA